MAALYALAKYADNPYVHERLISSLARETEPVIQVYIDINLPKDVTLSDISGGVVIQSTSGKVTVNSLVINKHKPVSIITETGPNYFAISSNTNAELKLGTATGTVHAMYNNGKGKTMMNGKQLNSKLGTEGPQIHIQSLSGDIHLVQY